MAPAAPPGLRARERRLPRLSAEPATLLCWAGVAPPSSNRTRVSGDPRSDRQWEHWPGRNPTDEGIRRKLRGIFAATDTGATVEALISERGREIDERTEQLHAAVADLERREELTARLRSAVEEMLHHGSTELDERHAALSALALELGTREEEVRAAERQVAIRTQELGAVELRRAAVERREQAVAEQLAALADVEPHEEEPPPVAAMAHIVILAADGYRLLERFGVVPRVDARVEIEGRACVVTRVGRSPLPGDLRVCAYLEPVRGSGDGL